MHDAYPPDMALPALGKIIVEQSGDFGWTEGVKVQFARDGQGDGFGFILNGHAGILEDQTIQATKNPPLGGAGF